MCPQSMSKPQQVPSGSVSRWGAVARRPTSSEALGLLLEQPEPGRCQPRGRSCPPRAAGAGRKLCKTLLARLGSAAGPPLCHPSPAPRAQRFAPHGEDVGVLVPNADSGPQAVCGWGPNPAPGRDAWLGAVAALEPRERRSCGTASAATWSPAGAAGGAEEGAGAVEPFPGPVLLLCSAIAFFSIIRQLIAGRNVINVCACVTRIYFEVLGVRRFCRLLQIKPAERGLSFKSFIFCYFKCP